MGATLVALKSAPEHDDRAVEQAIEHMTPTHLLCRDLGHYWEPWSLKRQRGGFLREMRCGRCETLRQQDLNGRGAVVSSHYVYSEGYLVHGMGRLTGQDRDRLRLASVLSLLKSRRGAHSA